MSLRPTWLLAVAGFAFAACGGGNGGQYSTPDGGMDGGYYPPQSVTEPRVAIHDFTFTPQSITIKAGQSVTWTNIGSSVHEVTSDTMVFESGNMAMGGHGPYRVSTEGGGLSFTFPTPGTYNYHSSLYPNFTGTVVVTE
ncbi:MAG TPA: plastocyanin/azurin family copper-binding protein [Myxococcales bacterium]|nr:plastocyanin/azurin family copper-binding protein [Myxococcales bacterium]